MVRDRDLEGQEVLSLASLSRLSLSPPRSPSSLFPLSLSSFSLSPLPVPSLSLLLSLYPLSLSDLEEEEVHVRQSH